MQIIKSHNNLQISFYFVDGVQTKIKEEWWERPAVKSDFHECDIMHCRPMFKSNIIH